VTNQERECIREAARRYVRDQGPIPPTALLEQVARIVLQAKIRQWTCEPDESLRNHDRPEAA
jgi:hypothetical protein